MPWDLWGVDMSTGMLKIAANQAINQLSTHHQPINLVLSDIKKTGLPNNFFDVIISNSVLHHLADPILFWREIKRIAKPKAFIFIRDLRRPASDIQADKIVALHVGNESSVVQTHYRSSLQSAYTVFEINQQLAEVQLCGLKVKELEDRYLDVYGQLVVNHE
jgi:ubiquinone/menaquinone biosynthesis C-methylase UbiE